MGLIANVYSITNRDYQAAISGDIDEFGSQDFCGCVVLEKTWHALHYMLYEDIEYRLFSGGREVDFFSEHTELYSADQVGILAALFRGSKKSKLGSRLNEGELNSRKIYPGDWVREDIISIYSDFDSVHALVRASDKERLGIFVVIS